MKNLVKNITYLVLFCIRNFLNLFFKFKEVSVLDYHSVNEDDWEFSVSPEIFEKQLFFLKKKGYYFASLDEIVSYIKNKSDLPTKTVAVTFDDGYEDVYTNAFPILKKYNIPATMFIFSDPLVKKSFLKEGSRQLSITQISEMKDSGLISFEHHSSTHRMLETLKDIDLKKELDNSHNYSYFAYPGGHYSNNVVEKVKKSGFKAAFSIKPGLINKKNDTFLIKRNVISRTMPFWQFKLRTTKAIDWYRRIVRVFK